MNHVHLIAIENTYADELGQHVQISASGTKDIVTEQLFVNIAAAIYGAIGQAEAMEAASIAALVGEFSEPDDINLALTGFTYAGSPMHTMSAAITLTDGRLHPFWLPYSFKNLDHKRAIQDGDWNRLVLDSVWAWLAVKLPSVGIDAGLIYVGDNIHTVMRNTAGIEAM